MYQPVTVGMDLKNPMGNASARRTVTVPKSETAPVHLRVIDTTILATGNVSRLTLKPVNPVSALHPMNKLSDQMG